MAEEKIDRTYKTIVEELEMLLTEAEFRIGRISRLIDDVYRYAQNKPFTQDLNRSKSTD